MVDFQGNSSTGQDLAAEKFSYGRSEEGIHNLTTDGGPVQMGMDHSNVLSIDNGELHSSNVWFSNSLDPEQRTASPIMMGDSALLEDEMWPEFLSQRAPRSLDDVDMRDIPGSRLSDKIQGTVHSTLSEAKDNIAEVLHEMDMVQRSSETQSSAHLQIPNQGSSSMKTKAVHWPDSVLVEKELKRQRSGVRRPSPPATQENSVAHTLRCAPVKFDTTSPQDFQHNRENVFKGEVSLEIDIVQNPQSQSLSIHGLEFEQSQDRPRNASTSILETASANGSECCSSSEKMKEPPSGDNAISFRAAKFATTRRLTGADFLSKDSTDKDRNSTANPLSTKGSVPVIPAKSGATPKSHQVQLVERHTGFRMISSAGVSADSGLPRESRWAEELLLECALAISSKNVVRTQHLMWVLNDLGCVTGDANQRLAAHGLKSLFCKVTGIGEAAGLNPTLGQMNAGPKSVHRALLKFHDVNPWHHMVYTVANSVMIDNFEGEEIVHVIDIGVSQGTQWPTFIEALATRASGPPLLRLTVVKDDEGAGTPGVPQGPSSTEFTVQLERFAKLMGIKIELHTVVSSLENLTRRKLGLKEGEALAICAQFRLHRLSEAIGNGELDENSLEPEKRSLSPRDRFLEFMHELQPKVVILSENDTNHLDSDFVTRFRPTVDYFWKFLDSTSYSFHGKQSQERQIIENEAAMAMVNNVACEGSQRIERNESHRGWTQRMERARFVPLLPREEILENIRTLVRKYDTNWEFGTDLNCVVLLWKHQPVTFCSVWKPA